MTPDPKLVAALANLLRATGDETPWWPEDVAERFLATHRLVQLPEEPNGAALDLGYEPSTGEPVCQYAEGEFGPVKPGTPVYIIPGDPQEVEP